MDVEEKWKNGGREERENLRMEERREGKERGKEGSARKGEMD